MPCEGRAFSARGTEGLIKAGEAAEGQECVQRRTEFPVRGEPPGLPANKSSGPRSAVAWTEVLDSRPSFVTH